MQLLDPPRHPDRPALVAEVALQLADDRRRGERRELEAPLGLEPLDRLDQAERRDLDEVVEGYAPVGEPPGEVLGQPEVRLDELVTDGPVPGGAVVDELPLQPLTLCVVESHQWSVRCFRSQTLRATTSMPWSSTTAPRICSVRSAVGSGARGVVCMAPSVVACTSSASSPSR